MAQPWDPVLSQPKLLSLMPLSVPVRLDGMDEMTQDQTIANPYQRYGGASAEAVVWSDELACNEEDPAQS